MRTSTEKITRPRGRPREFDPEAVLDKARQEFLRKGFSATSLDDLSAATGLNRPSLYAAFGDKEQLYIAALRLYGARGTAAIADHLAKPQPLADRLGRVFAAATALYCTPPHGGCMIIGTATTESPSRPAIAAAAAELLGGMEREFEKAFERAAAEGEVAQSPPPAIRAKLATAILHTLSVRARLGGKSDELIAFAMAAVPMICAAGA